MSIPFLPGYRREPGGRSQFPKSHHFDVRQGVPLPVARDVVVDPRSFIPPSSFNGTGTLTNAGSSIIAGAHDISANSGATSYTHSGRVPEGQQVERGFMTASQRAAEDKYAHLRRAPVARDFDHTAAPLPHLPLMDESRLPSWVEFDKKVLRFSGYFKEAVHASSVERWRLRSVLVYFYLEDDTMHLAEPGQTNSGITSGIFLKRHRVPKDEAGGFFTVEDLWIGAQLPIYGRVVRLTAADAFTRAFYAQNGSPLGADEPQPTDPFTARHTAAQPLTHKKLLNPLTVHQEASLGKTVHGHEGIRRTQQFLKHDGSVLRFYATWSDEDSLYGEKLPLIVHYYRADDTIEVAMVTQPNSGRAPFPYLLKRGKLPKDHTLVPRDVAHLGAGNRPEQQPGVTFITERDLRVGSTLNVYGRPVLLCGVDEYTRKYYMDNYGMKEEELASIHMNEAEHAIPPPKIEVPPPTGFGTEEDSLGSFLYLIPKPPKTDQNKQARMDGILLRFLAKFKNPMPQDKDRFFIVTYYLANDTIMMFEPFAPNTGHIGGKFMDRQRVINPATGHYFAPGDLYMGALVQLQGQEFAILEADEYTKKFMEQNKEIWNADKGNVNDTQKALALNRGQPIQMAKPEDIYKNRRPY